MSAPDQPTITSAYRSVGVTFETLICSSACFKETLQLARSAAASDVSVLLLGETGTGKNLIAQSIHNASARAAASFIGVNCSAIPDSLLESELFGAEKGAYTSADRLRRGKFELANHGTLFLDEIGDMSPIAQSKVLRAFEYKEFERVGGEEKLHSDVRLIAATNRPIEKLLDGGQFREDLFYRLNEFTIEIPPLRDRREEIPLLVRSFIGECNERYGSHVTDVSPAVMTMLKTHTWPGNVRELRAVLKRACVALVGSVIEPKHIRLARPGNRGSLSGDVSLSAMEARHIEKVLGSTGWNKKESSKLLGISRPTLDRKINDYSLKRP